MQDRLLTCLREAIAQYLGRTDPVSVKEALADLHAPGNNLYAEIGEV